MSASLMACPSCEAWPIEAGLKALGIEYLAMEGRGSEKAIAKVRGPDGRLGVASHATLEEAAAPLVEWANSEGELLRLYQRACRRLGIVNSINLHTLMKSMQ